MRDIKNRFVDTHKLLFFPLFYLFVFFLLSGQSSAEEANSPICAPYRHNPGALFLEYTGGSGRSYKGGYEGIESLLVFKGNCNHFTFFDLGIEKINQKGQYASNIGWGFRSVAPDFCEMFGANVFYDFRGIPEGDFHQAGAGIELFGRNWDVRGNIYVPFGANEVFIDTTTYNYSGGYSATSRRYKTGMWGLDMEIGRCLFANRCFNLYGAIGPYFYSSPCSCSGDIVGGLGRLSLVVCQCLLLEGYGTYDCLFGSHLQGRILLSLPFPCRVKCWSYFFQPIRRNKIIVLDNICYWNTNY